MLIFLRPIPKNYILKRPNIYLRRLLVLSVTETKTTKISMFDLETLHLLATTETNLFRGTAAGTSILWKVRKTLKYRLINQFFDREAIGLYSMQAASIFIRGIRYKIR